MATYYWVGGAGTWDNSSTTHWALSSGGAANAGVPTSADNVIFDTLSNATAYAVTVGTNAVAQDITIAGPATGSVTITLGATAVINCYGSWTNAATGVVFSNTAGCAINFLATTTGKTFTTNGVSFPSGSPNITFGGVGGGWTLGSALTTTGIVYSTNGTFSTGNFAMSVAVINIGTTATARTVNLGSSTINLSNAAPWVTTTTTNLTFNAGTSTINCSNAAPTFAGGGLTYYNVNFTGTNAGQATTVTGANTFNNLTQASPTSNRRLLVFGTNQIVSGILTLGTANAYNARIQTQSVNSGAPVTLTVATIATLSDVDFRDIAAAGASAPWSGTRLGNGLGNSGITFAAGKTVYWNLVAGGNWSANAWATSSGGAVATANFPLAQDTAIIDNTGLTAGNTITMDASWYVGTVNCTRSNAWNYVGTGGVTVCGDFTIPSVTTVTGTANLFFQGQGLTQTLTTNGVSLTMGVTQQSFGGTLVLNGPVTCASTATVTLNNGTLNLGSYTVTTGLFTTGASTNALAFGTGNITLTGVGTIFTGSTTCTVTGTPQVILNNNTASARTVTAGAVTEANSISFRVISGTGSMVFTAGSVRDLDFTDGTNPTGFAGNVTNTANTIYGSFKASTGMTRTAGTQAYTFAATSGTKTINTAGVTFDNPFTFNGVGGTWQLQSALTSGDTRTTTLTAGTLDLNNFILSTGIFSSTGSAARTINSGSGTFTITGTNTGVVAIGTSTNLTVDTRPTFNLTTSPAVSTGTRSVSYGASANLAAVPNINVTNGSDTFTTTGTTTVNNLNLTGFTGTFGNATRNIYGNLTMNGTMAGVTAGTLVTTFNGVGSQTITSAGQSLDFPVTFDGVGGTWTLQDAMTVGSTRTTTLTNGALVLNGFDLSTGLFSSTNTNIRTINFGSNKVVVTGSAATLFSINTATNLTLLGTPQVEATYSGSTGTRIFVMGTTFSNPEASAVSLRVSAGGDTVSLSTTSSAYKNVEFTSGFTGTVSIANSFSVYGNWSFSPNMVTPTTGSGTITFASTSVTPRTLTSNGKAFGPSSINFNGVGGTWQLQDNFAIGSANTINLTNGTLDLNNFTATGGNFVSSNSNTRAIAFGTGKIVVAGNATNVWNTDTATNFTYTGTSRVELTYSGATGTRAIYHGITGGTEANSPNFYITAGTDTINFAGSGRKFGTIDFTGFGAGTGNVGNTQTIYGNLVLVSAMTLPSQSTALTFGSTSGTKTVTTAGKTVDMQLIFDGVGGTWAFQDALTLGSTKIITLTNGTLKLKSGTTNTVAGFATPSGNQTYLQATTPGVQATISDSSGTNTATNITIQDSAATGGATWSASNSLGIVNAGNNSGWNFATALSGVTGTGAVGTVISGVNPSALSGVQATGAVGTIYIGWRDVPTTQTPAWTPVITS